ncbi:MAG: DUF2225 domain-containing protein [Sedimentisphaerales bacterium]|nr:DUF2225 domain-containing protein [Sedimentisphaerales bacterium]
MRAEKNLNTLIYFAIICMLAKECCGVTVGETKRSCPVCEEQITVLEIATFGSYIYNRESKYDLIYCPYDDPEFIWMCPYCGYAQVSRYFADLSSEEKNKLKSFLSTRWEPASPNDISIEAPNDISAIEMRFNQAILVNKFLEKDEDFWAWFNRVLIFHYRKIDPDKAKAFAVDEIELLQKGKGKFKAPEKSRAYLLGEYNRMVGNSELARKHLSQALKVDTVSEIKRANTALIILNFILFFSLLFTWIKKGLTKKNRVIYTIIVIIAFACCSFIHYWIPELVRQEEYMNKYYNEIIYDRINLLYAESE